MSFFAASSLVNLGVEKNLNKSFRPFPNVIRQIGGRARGRRWKSSKQHDKKFQAATLKNGSREIKRDKKTSYLLLSPKAVAQSAKKTN